MHSNWLYFNSSSLKSLSIWCSMESNSFLKGNVHCKKEKLILEGIVWNILQTKINNRVSCTINYNKDRNFSLVIISRWKSDFSQAFWYQTFWLSILNLTSRDRSDRLIQVPKLSLFVRLEWYGQAWIWGESTQSMQ